MSSLKRVLTKQLPTPKQRVELESIEAHHILKVLRLRDGDTVEAFDGHGGKAQAVLRVRKEQVWIEFLSSAEKTNPHIVPCTLYQAILKGDAMEWTVEKCVELGVQSFVPIQTDYTVVQLNKKGPEVFQERWQKIADQALKQCGRTARMAIETPIKLQDISPAEDSAFFWCDERSRETETPFLLPELLKLKPKPPHLNVLIGPEGGFSPTEVDFLTRSANPLFKRVQLGPLVLRAETAALFAMSTLNGYFWSYGN